MPSIDNLLVKNNATRYFKTVRKEYIKKEQLWLTFYVLAINTITAYGITVRERKVEVKYNYIHRSETL